MFEERRDNMLCKTCEKEKVFNNGLVICSPKVCNNTRKFSHMYCEVCADEMNVCERCGIELKEDK